MSELNKYFTSDTIEILRSEINLATYNPRKITDEAKRRLKANIKKQGIIGGLIYNIPTKTLVSGHQRISILDDLNKYNPETAENDYTVKVEAISVDLKTEKELNIWFNNTSVQGEFDIDALRELIPEIDYKSAGLTEEDLNIIGIDLELKTESQSNIESELEQLMQPTAEKREVEKAINKEAVKAEKQRIKEQAEEKAQNMTSYIVLNFESGKNKEAFLRRFGFKIDQQYLKGEHFADMIERVE